MGGRGGGWEEFLGHTIVKGVNSVPGSRAEAIAHYTQPKTKKSLRTFLGMVSYYRKILSNLAEHTAVLSSLTSRTAPNRVDWTFDMKQSFSNICKCIAMSCSLTIPLPEVNFFLVTDASGRGIGGVLQVHRDGEWMAAVYYSRGA